MKVDYPSGACQWEVASRIRAATMRDGLDLSSLSGLEVGPLAHPLIGKFEGDITYVDYTDSDTLRHIYANSGFADRIVNVDAIWGGQSLISCLGGKQVDYIVASHVAEHVPDLVTWLAETREVLRPGGELRLALPDVRFSNDVLRPPTRLSDLLTAWMIKARRPQLRDVLDFRLNEAIEVDGCGFFYGTASRGDVRPYRSIEDALECGRAVLEQPEKYFDVHCLAASGLQFATLMEQLAEAGLLTMACARMIDTAPPLYEFYAFLTPCDSPETVKKSWRAAREACADPPPGSAAAILAAQHAEEYARIMNDLPLVWDRLAATEMRYAELDARHALLNARHSELQARCASLEVQLSETMTAHETKAARLNTEIHTLRDALTRSEADVRALHDSLSWRITAPMRKVKTFFSR